MARPAAERSMVTNFTPRTLLRHVINSLTPQTPAEGPTAGFTPARTPAGVTPVGVTPANAHFASTVTPASAVTAAFSLRSASRTPAIQSLVPTPVITLAQDRKRTAAAVAPEGNFAVPRPKRRRTDTATALFTDTLTRDLFYTFAKGFNQAKGLIPVVSDMYVG